MSNDNKSNKVPLECPSNQNKTKVDPIIDVVENEIYPPANQDVIDIISKSPQE